MKIFNRKKKEKKYEDMSILEIIENCPHINPMNISSIENILKKDPDVDRIWMNPNQQASYNAGWLSKQDFIDWSNGTGIAVKGKTQKDKNKYMHYAKSYMELDWQLFAYSEHLHLLNSKKVLIMPSNYFRVTDDDLELKIKGRSNTEIINDLLSNYTREIKADLKNKIAYIRAVHETDIIKFERKAIKEISNKYRDEIRIMCWTIGIMGIGYHTAVNTPQLLENLAWSQSLPFAVAYYEFLEEDGYDLPDFDFINKNEF